MRECKALGGFTFYFYFVSRVYSVCVGDELQRVIMNPTYPSRRLHTIYHLISHSIGIVLVIIFAATDNLGVSFSLLCWNKFKTDKASLPIK